MRYTRLCVCMWQTHLPHCSLLLPTSPTPPSFTSQAKMRDHRVLGVQQELFFIHQLSPSSLTPASCPPPPRPRSVTTEC